MRRHSVLVSALPALALVAAACSGDSPTGSSANAVKIAFSTQGSTAASGRLVNAFTVAQGGNSLVVTKAQVVFSKIELADAATAATCGDDGESGGDGAVVAATASADDHGGSSGDGAEGCEGLEVQPTVVDLPVDASVVTQLNASIPAGTYSALEAKVHVVQSGDNGGAAFLAAHPELAGASVRVEGTFNGTPFTYVGRPDARLELSFSPPIVVGTGGASITVHVDLGSWFLDGSGNVIDPATAASGGVNESLVENNIKRSFHAFEDENHDGEDDHGSH
jgi:hypothetical protein